VRLAAPPVGGALFAVGRAVPFLADAVSYAFSTASALLMRTRFQEERERDAAPLRRRLTEGIVFYLRIPFLRTMLGLIAVSNFTVTAMQLAVIVLARRDGLSSTVVGAFVALVGATTLLGSLLTPLVRRLLPIRAILLSEFWAAFAYCAFLVRPSPYVLAAAVATQAFCFPNTDAAITAYNYALIPDRLLGRALAASDTLRVLGAPLGPLAAGLLLDSVSPRWTVALLASATIAVTVPATLSRSIRDAPSLEDITASPPDMAVGDL
jgi:MFS family permease